VTDDLDFSRSRLSWTDRLRVGQMDLSVEVIAAHLREHLKPERIARLTEVVDQRSLHFVSVLENIYDRGNVSAVMRSAEAFGFMQVHLVDRPGAKFKAANRITRGAEKWLDVRQFHDPVVAVDDLRARGYQVWATDLNTEHTIDSIDWTRPTAVVLGNEKDGTSPEMLAAVDGRFKLPMLGFSQSFNISVAASLIFYRAHLEMRALGDAARLSEAQRRQVMANYLVRCFDNPEGILRAHERP
jgi:tRNA (guanosine-2'-O-)-methyltransferase